VAESSPNPRGPWPASNDPRLGEAGHEVRRSLVEDLGQVVDDIRQLATDLGARPYTVHVVRIAWSGGEVGRGEPSTALELQILPTPRLTGVGEGAVRSQEPGGAIERGDVRLTGVAPRYTEDELGNYFGVEPGEECFFEVRIDQRDGEARRRRYVLARPPERRPEHCDWVLVLRRHDGDRQRDGTRRPARTERWV